MAMDTEAPYQYLVLLWAISAALDGTVLPLPYSVARPQIAPILNRFAVAKSPPKVANPWFALRQTPWWNIPNPVRRYQDVSSSDMSAGLSPQIIRLIEVDDTFAGRAVAEIESILSGMAAHAEHVGQVLDELGLNQLRRYRLIPVESNVAESFTVDPPEVSGVERKRKEADLQTAYRAYLEKQGHQVSSVEIFDNGQTLRVDLFDVDEEDLIEVKSSAQRATVRLG